MNKTNAIETARRYTTELQEDDLVKIHDTKTGRQTFWPFSAFVSGQRGFDERTDKFPLYVHSKVWELFREDRDSLM